MQPVKLETARDNYNALLCNQLHLGTPVITPAYLVVAYTTTRCNVVIHTVPKLVAGCICDQIRCAKISFL